MQAVLLVPLLLLLALVLYRVLTMIYNYQSRKWVLKGLYRPNSWFPFWSALLGTNVEEKTKEIVNEAPDASFVDMGFEFDGYPVVAVINPEVFKEILGDQERFPKVIQQAGRILIGETGLVFSAGEIWKRDRRLLTPGFHFGVLKDLIPSMVSESKSFVNSISSRSGETLLAKQVYVSITLRVIIRTAFGGHFDANWMEEKWTRALSHLIKYTLTYGIFGRLANILPWSSPFPNNMAEIAERGKKFISERRKTPAENQPKSDIVGLMLHGGSYSDEEILDQVKTFLVAGHETTSNLLSWSTYFLCLHPEAQEKAFQEVNEVMGNDDPTGDNIPKLRYIKAILEETLRLRPVVTAIPARICQNDETLLGKKFPAGTRLLMNILACHWNDRYWPNALQFMPERFLSKDHENRHPFAYIPFSAGPRNCIGQRFALQEATIILSMMLQHFKFEMVGNGCKMVNIPTLTPDNFFVRFIPRKE